MTTKYAVDNYTCSFANLQYTYLPSNRGGALIHLELKTR